MVTVVGAPALPAPLPAPAAFWHFAKHPAPAAGLSPFPHLASNPEPPRRAARAASGRTRPPQA